jgi:fructose-1,6-bisphosphatase I
MRANGHGFREWYVVLLISVVIVILTLRQAGGQAIDSNMKRMLEVTPTHIHDRSGIFLGSFDEVQKVIDVHKKYEK